uniref:Uncharacterized protein n=1 Tax=Anopheles farauti TaxID=69004 RepID=A0A182QWN9_9DIPT
MFAHSLLALLLLPGCLCQMSSYPTADGGELTQGSGGFGYELLRNQLDELQESISQLQQKVDHQDGCTALGTAMATILNRLQAIETKLNEAPPPTPPNNQQFLQNFQQILLNQARASAERANIQMQMADRRQTAQLEVNDDVRRHQFVPAGAQPQIRLPNHYGSQQSFHTMQSSSPTQTKYEREYNSCDEVPETGVWKIRNGIQVVNTYCIV